MNTTANITTQEVATRPEAGKDAVVTNLTIDWEGMSLEDTRTLAAQALIVKLQGAWRKSTIPAGDFTVKAYDHRPGVRAPKEKLSLAEQIKRLDPEARAALLASLAG